MNSELSQQQLLGNDSPNLTAEQNPADVPTARDLLGGDTPPINRRADSNDQKTSVPDQLGAVNEEGDSPTVQYQGAQMASKSPGDDIEEDDGKMLQEEDHDHDQEIKETEGRNLVEEDPQEEPIAQTADLPTKKDNNVTSGLIQVKPTPRKQKRFATVRSFYSRVAKLRSMNSFWEKEAANVNMKREMRDHYVNVADLLPEGIDSAAELQKLYEDKRSMKKIRHLSSFPKAHEDEVLCLIFTPDRKFIVSGSNDRTIKIWDVNTKRQLYHFKDAHEDGVRKLAMTSDSKYLISGSMDNSAKMWDFTTRQLIHHFKDAHNERVSGISITSDNKYMVTCSWDKSIKIFDLNAKEQIAHLEDVHTNIIRAIEVTSDSKYIISASADGTVKLFDFYTRQNIFTFEDLHSSEILTMALTPDNKFIVTGSADQTIKILDIEDRKEIHCWNEGIDDQVGEVAISSDGQYLFAGIADGSMLMLEMDSKKLTKHFKDVHQDRFYGLAVSENMDFAISCSSDKSIEVTEIEEKKKMFGYLKKAHTGSLAAVTFTSDSQHLITGADDLSIKMFDVKTKKLVHTWSNVQSDKIASLCVTPNNKYLVSGSWDYSIKIFDLETKEDYHTFPNVLTNVIRQIAISSDGKYVVAGGDDRALRLYDIEEKKEVHHIQEAHDAAIYGVAITPDNNYIISCSGDKSIKIFDLDSKELVYKFKEAHNDEVFAVVVTPNNKYIVSASRDFSIKIFELETKQLVHTFVHAHDNSIFTLTVSPDSRFVASGSADESVRVFDLECREMVCHFQNVQNEWIWAVAFSPNNKYLASGAGDGSVKIIDFETNLEEHHFESPLGGNSIYSVAVSPDNQMMAAGSSGGDVAIFNMETKERLCIFNYAHSGSTKAVAWTPDSKFVVSGSADTHICVFDVEKQEEVNGVRFAHREMIYAIAVTPDGKYIVSGSKDRSIKVIEFANREVYHHFKEIHEETIRSVAVTPDSKYIISASTDKSIKVLDIEKKQLVYHFRGAHPRWIKSVSVSSDGKLIASCSDDRSIKLFDLQTKQLVHWFKNAHDDFIESVAISNDCRYIVSGSRDKSVRIFDIQTKQQIQQFKKVHNDRVRAVALTSDNQFIISSSVGGSIKILRMSPIALPSSQESTVSQGLLTTSGIQLAASEIYYVYNGFAKYSNFNAVDDFLFNPNIPIKTINASLERCQNLTVFPYAWNILHIAAIRAQHSFIKHMPEYSQFKVPFLLDAAGKTPLHYLIAHDKLNSNSMNVMLTYICDFVDGLHKYQHFQAQEILISLTPLFWLILAKTEIKIRERFLDICFIAPPMPYNFELPIFGRPAANVGYFHPSLGSIYHSINNIWTKGDDTIDFRTNIINIDYNVLSDDMTKTIKVLRRQANEEVFKTGLIIKLIDHLWDQSRNILLLRFGIFSAFIIALSVYLSLGDNYQAFDIVILVGAGYFLFSELLQVINLKLDYALDPWNWLDSAHFGLALAFAIDRLAHGYRDNITMAWIATVIIMTGYLRWISYLKIFKPTRNLIQVIVAILSDMKSFIIIIAMIIIGFSFIFLFFNKGSLWGFYLMDSYGSMYGPIDGEDPNFSQKLLICFISFLLNVVLLNLLISIMGDSYERVLEKRVKTDSLTRLEMIAEATTHMKYWSFLFSFLFSRKTTEKGYLIFCLAPDAVDDDEAENDWEGKIHILRKLIKGSETSTEKRIMTLENEMNRKFEKSRKEQLELHEKTNEILKLLKDIKNNQTASQPKQ